MRPYISGFNIRVVKKNNTDSFFSTDGEKIVEVMSDTRLLSTNVLQVCADPFLFVRSNRLFLFYEKQYQLKGKGYIAMISTENLSDWSEEKTVLKEPFHLSFPFVFEDEGKCYMIPEANHSDAIRLYEAADESLEHWNYLCDLTKEKNNWVDSSILKLDGYYYLFTTTTDSNRIQSQRLFISKELKGEYIEHPKSPVYIGNDYGRNAGSIFRYQNMLLRPTQDCVNDYGKQVHIRHITCISPTDFAEETYKYNIVNTNEPFYKGGGHQFNPIEWKTSYIIASDAKIKNYNIIETLRRIKEKLVK